MTQFTDGLRLMDIQRQNSIHTQAVSHKDMHTLKIYHLNTPYVPDKKAMIKLSFSFFIHSV